jgi:putative hemolysin
MKKKIYITISTILALMLLLVIVIYIRLNFTYHIDNLPTNQNNQTDEELKLANPASVNCINQGGILEMRSNKKGTYGVCMFEDNRQCEEWAMFRGNCPVGGLKITGYENEAQVYCAITGGQVEGLDTTNPMCKRVDGTYCNTQANFDGDCPDPSDPSPSAGNTEIP